MQQVKISKAARVVVAVVSLALAVLIGGAQTADAQFLHGSDRDGRMFFIDINTGMGTFLCNMPTFPDPGCTEIEFDFNTLTAVLQTRDGTFYSQLFDVFNCASNAPLISNGAAFNGLEFVNGVLYGTGIQDQCGPSTLMIVNPYNGATTPIGPTGLGPISGLAWSPSAQTMYGITGCTQRLGLSQLVTIDLGTGAATVVGPTGIEAGGLEFGPDGRLYAGGNRQDGGNLYRIDTVSGAATFIGWTGTIGLTGLTFAQFPLAIEESTWGRIKALYSE